MSDTRTWTTTGPTITTTTASGSAPRTIVTHAGPTYHSTTTSTSAYRASPSGPRTSAAQSPSPAPPAASPDHARHGRGVPHDPALHEYDHHHGLGETSDQHALHSKVTPVEHWGLPPKSERVLFYFFAITSWIFEITAAVLGSVRGTAHGPFIATFTVYAVLHAAAWFQTAVGMVQRASWVRDESNLPDRRRFLYLAVRLNRLMLPSALIAFITFVIAYVRRNGTHDTANWLLFLLFFIFGTVFSVMNAYNNITWESDRLEYEEGSSPYGNTLLAVLGIPSDPRPDWRERID